MLHILAASALAAAAPVTTEVTAPGPKGNLAGTMVDAGKGAPVVLIIPGSGPTDRDGNNGIGPSGSYRLLAEALGQRGISTVRIDKRGMFGSKEAVADPDAVKTADYVADIRSWIRVIRGKTGADCVWLAGHSEGGVVALKAAGTPEGICGVVTLSAFGRRLGDTIRAQLRANPANAPLLDPALSILDRLEKGRKVPAAEIPPPLAPLFRPEVQDYIIDVLALDPAALAASLTVPLLVVQGETDIQTSVEDAKLLSGAQPKAKLVLIPGVNHVLKAAPLDRAANIAAYREASLPIAPAVVDAVAGFVKP
ncbi:alpha/beta fold hydrolase [Sphingomonas sp. LHG3406-1]|uniref:alpha/beta hydrolase n=1 Tax=Sphingomonas sp. LHG3406-1 TaxID=2804617 RepID=UPI002625BF09|nr:alpha/beta fold hydrolase [Sphingomonas sp. LHG3406-1]